MWVKWRKRVGFVEMVAELFVESTKPVQQSAAPSVLARFHKLPGKIHAQQHSTKNVKSYK